MPFLNLLVGNKAGVATILIANLWILRKNIVLGLAAFLAFASLFLEHRRRIVRRTQEAMSGATNAGAPIGELEKGSPDLIKGERHPSASDHSYEDYNYEPGQESHSSAKGGDTENAESKGDAPDMIPGESVDNKEPLGTISTDSETAGDFFQNRGLARPFEASNSA